MSKMQKLNFPVYSRIPVFRGFPENYNETPLSEYTIQNFRKGYFKDLS